MSSVVYFIKAGSRIKIGFTTNLKLRFSSIQGSSPEHAELLGTVPGGKELERSFHHKLRAHRHKNEWFNDCEEVRQHIAEVVAENAPFTPKPAAPVVQRAEEAFDETDDKDLSDRALSDISERFSAIVNHRLMDHVHQARALEHKLGLARGEIVSTIVGGTDPIEKVRLAYNTLRRNHRKFGKVLDRLQLIFDDYGTPEAPLRCAAQILIERTEAAFAAIEIKKPELRMAFLSAPRSPSCDRASA